MKRTLSLFLLLCQLPGILPLGAFATQPDPTEATAEEWNLRQPDQCGDDMTWSFSGDTLTVSGTGEMDDYPEAAFFNVGTLDDVIAKAERIKAGEF